MGCPAPISPDVLFFVKNIESFRDAKAVGDDLVYRQGLPDHQRRLLELKDVGMSDEEAEKELEKVEAEERYQREREDLAAKTMKRAEEKLEFANRQVEKAVRIKNEARNNYEQQDKGKLDTKGIANAYEEDMPPLMFVNCTGECAAISIQN